MKYRCPNCDTDFVADADLFAQMRVAICPHCKHAVHYTPAILMSMAHLVETRLIMPAGVKLVRPM